MLRFLFVLLCAGLREYGSGRRQGKGRQAERSGKGLLRIWTSVERRNVEQRIGGKADRMRTAACKHLIAEGRIGMPDESVCRLGRKAGVQWMKLTISEFAVWIEQKGPWGGQDLMRERKQMRAD